MPTLNQQLDALKTYIPSMAIINNSPTSDTENSPIAVGNNVTGAKTPHSS